MSYFPEPYSHSKNKVKVKLDFPYYTAILIIQQNLT